MSFTLSPRDSVPEVRRRDPCFDITEYSVLRMYCTIFLPLVAVVWLVMLSSVARHRHRLQVAIQPTSTVAAAADVLGYDGSSGLWL